MAYQKGFRGRKELSKYFHDLYFGVRCGMQGLSNVRGTPLNLPSSVVHIYENLRGGLKALEEIEKNTFISHILKGLFDYEIKPLEIQNIVGVINNTLEDKIQKKEIEETISKMDALSMHLKRVSEYLLV